MQLLAETEQSQISVKIRRPSGLDARSAVAVANAANRYRCPITIACGNETVDARSIMDLILLNARNDQDLLIGAEGDDANRALDAMRELVENDFGVPN